MSVMVVVVVIAIHTGPHFGGGMNVTPNAMHRQSLWNNSFHIEPALCYENIQLEDIKSFCSETKSRAEVPIYNPYSVLR